MTSPVRVGLLFDFPQGDGGESFENAVRLGIETVAATGRLDRRLECVRALCTGLPSGSAYEVEQAFASLCDAGVLAVVGPSISDNGIVVRDLAVAAEVPCINYTGGAITRSEWMLHYQVGSLEEEPAVLAAHLAARGVRRIALLSDRSPVGRGYTEYFRLAAETGNLEVVGAAELSALTPEDGAGGQVTRALAGAPDALVYLGLGVAARAVAVAVATQQFGGPVVANSALMFGYARREWRAGWEGWHYTDTVSDTNSERMALAERSPQTAAGPVSVAGYDIGRLLGEGLARSDHLSRAGLHDGLLRVKRLRAASGYEGTTMGFGPYDHAALKGDYLVLRSWQGGRSVEVPR